MLATPELIREAGQLSQLARLLPRWRAVPLYRNRLAPAEDHPLETDPLAGFRRLPLLAKREMRDGFPRNFLPEGRTLETLLENQLVELEHTSGTSEERLPVIFGRGWWETQEKRALRLNRFVAGVLDAPPDARRATLVPPACNGLTCPTVWMSREATNGGQHPVREPGAHPVSSGRPGTGAHGGGDFRMVAAISGRGPGSRRLVRALLRAARESACRR